MVVVNPYTASSLASGQTAFNEQRRENYLWSGLGALIALFFVAAVLGVLELWRGRPKEALERSKAEVLRQTLEIEELQGERNDLEGRNATMLAENTRLTGVVQNQCGEINAKNVQLDRLAPFESEAFSLRAQYTDLSDDQQQARRSIAELSAQLAASESKHETLLKSYKYIKDVLAEKVDECKRIKNELQDQQRRHEQERLAQQQRHARILAEEEALMKDRDHCHEQERLAQQQHHEKTLEEVRVQMETKINNVIMVKDQETDLWRRKAKRLEAERVNPSP